MDLLSICHRLQCNTFIGICGEICTYVSAFHSASKVFCHVFAVSDPTWRTSTAPPPHWDAGGPQHYCIMLFTLCLCFVGCSCEHLPWHALQAIQLLASSMSFTIHSRMFCHCITTHNANTFPLYLFNLHQGEDASWQFCHNTCCRQAIHHYTNQCSMCWHTTQCSR